MGIRPRNFEVTAVPQLKGMLKRVAASRPDAFVFLQDPLLEPMIPEIAAFAREHKLVSIGATGLWVSAGGLLAYVPDAREILRAERMIE